MTNFKYPGFFVSFEGIDGAGKSYQVSVITKWLQKSQKTDVFSTKEPSDSNIGTKVREILLKKAELSPQAAIFLVMADRCEHVYKSILPNLNKGRVVISDRYLDSTFAYQGRSKKIDLTWLKSWCDSNLPMPDLTFWLDVPVKKALQRVNARSNIGGSLESVFEKESILNKVFQQYKDLHNSDSSRIKRINASLNTEDVTKEIIEHIKLHPHFKK